MRIRTNQYRLISMVAIILTEQIDSNSELSVIAERLEDAANLILDVSQEISRDFAASQQDLKLPTQYHREELIQDQNLA